MRKKKQPTADMLRAQLALAADEIIRLKTALAQWESLVLTNERGEVLVVLPAETVARSQWWRRLLAWVGA